jgi:hypothetical protein
MCADLCSRRDALAFLSSGFGLVALRDLLAQEGPKTPRFAAKAKNVILCYMSGGVSHVDTFDPKPALDKLAGKPMPVPVLRTQFNQNGSVTPSYWAYQNRGKSGLPVSDLLPEIGSCADDLCVIRSMTSKFSEHAQGNLFMHTGFPFIGYPSAGAWTSYGLGSESKNLPGYMVLRSGDATAPHGGVGVYGSGFLPAQHQASLISVDKPEPLPNVKPREEAAAQRKRLDLIGALDRDFAGAAGPDPSLEAAIANYEMAWRMQSAVPELCDLRNEDPSMTKLYGLDDPEPKTAAYARQCLTARRLVERGVRFVELSCLTYNIGAGNAPNPWDQHSDLKKGHGAQGHQIDRPIAGLLKDLKARGLLDTTLVLWMGEFGRTPFSQGSNGRDHNPYGFSVWMAGGGVKGGLAYGATDEFGFAAVEKKVHVHDLQATILHLLGFDHEKLTYRYAGRDFRLTDVHGKVVKDVLA